MKILVLGDLHGKKPKLLTKDFDFIIQIGDICGDKDLEDFYRQFFAYLKKDPDMKFEDFVRKNFGKRKYEAAEKRALQKGKAVLQWLDSLGKPVFFVPGNYDFSYGPSRIKEKNMEKNTYNYLKTFLDWWAAKYTNKKLTKGLKNVYDCQFSLWKNFGVNIIGYGLCSGPESPFRKLRKKRSFSPIQQKRLKKAYNKLKDQLTFAVKMKDRKLPLIFVSHNVPHKTKLDKIKMKNNVNEKKHAGSTVVRWFIQRYKPLLSIGGHVHEGVGKEKLGNTLCINAGGAHETQVLIELDEKKKKIRKVRFLKR